MAVPAQTREVITSDARIPTRQGTTVSHFEVQTVPRPELVLMQPGITSTTASSLPSALTSQERRPFRLHGHHRYHHSHPDASTRSRFSTRGGQDEAQLVKYKQTRRTRETCRESELCCAGWVSVSE